MPTSYLLDLQSESGRRAEIPPPQFLHAAVATWLAESDDTHHQQEKMWSLPSPAAQGDRLRVFVNWLPDAGMPRLDITSGTVRFGNRFYQVVGVEAREVPLPLLVLDTARTAEFDFLTPTWFSRSGGEYCLPDPYLVFRRLADRWTDVDAAGMLPEEALAEVCDTARITRFDGRTAPFNTGRARRTGFVGGCRYQLPRDASLQARNAFAALCRFAAFSGVGAMTTFGAGSVAVALSRE